MGLRGVLKGWGKYKGKKNESEREEKRRETTDSRVRGKNGVKGGTEAITCVNRYSFQYVQNCSEKAPF